MNLASAMWEPAYLSIAASAVQMLLEKQPSVTAPLHDIRPVFYKTISAMLYLLDFGSNIFVAIHYYESTFKGKTFQSINPGGGKPEDERWGAPPVFQIMVVLMVFGHVSCFIVFLLEGLRREEHPVQLYKFMRKALGWYFLPLAQFRRALHGLQRRPSNVNGDSRPTTKDEARMEALYAIASATTDGGPLFLLQYFTLTIRTSTFSKSGYLWKPDGVLVLSLCLSALSAVWNVTRAIIFLLPSRSRFLALAAGASTLSALTVRCTSFVSILALQLELNPSKFFVILGTYILLGSAVPFIGYCFLSREGTSEVKCSALSKSTLKAAGFTWVSFSFGPLYPFASVVETSTTMRVSTTRFHAQLFFYAACRWTLEISLMSTLLIKRWSLCNRNNFHDHSAILYQWGYLIESMMPCHLYISALAIGLPIAILSQVLFQIVAQTKAVDTSQYDYAQKESTLAAAGALKIGSIGKDVVGFTGV